MNQQWVDRQLLQLANEPGGMAYLIALAKIRIGFRSEAVKKGFIAGLEFNKTEGLFNLWFNEPKIKDLSVAAVNEILKHEIMHLLFGHVGEYGTDLVKTYGRRIANVAADLVINQQINLGILDKEGIHGVRVSEYELPKDMPTEWYARWLKAHPDKLPETFDEFTEVIDHGVQQAAGELSKHVCKTLAARSEVIPAGWEKHMATQQVQPSRTRPMNWKNILRAFENKVRDEERILDYRRRSRRNVALIGRRRSFRLDIWFCIDVSGSMDVEEFKPLDSEIRAIASRGAHITVLQADTKLQSKKPFLRDTVVNEFKGRGGTDFSPFFLELDSLHTDVRPQLLIVYTDGYGDMKKFRDLHPEFGRRAPYNIPVLWLISRGGIKIKDFRRTIGFGAAVEMGS